MEVQLFILFLFWHRLLTIWQPLLLTGRLSTRCCYGGQNVVIDVWKLLGCISMNLC